MLPEQNMFCPRHLLRHLGTAFVGGVGAVVAMGLMNSWPISSRPTLLLQTVPSSASVPETLPPTGVAPQDLDLEGRYSPDEQINIRVYNQVNASVVNIQTITFVRDFFSVVPEAGAGSGWVLDKQGHIVTNHHVIGDSQRIEVTLANGSSYRAEVVGQDPPNYIAVIKIQAPPQELVPIPLGDSTQLLVGQKVLAVGNPFGL